MVHGSTSLILFVIGALLLLVEAFIPGGILGVIGCGLIGGALAGILFPSYYWIAFWGGFGLVAVGSAVGLIAIYKKWRPSHKEVMNASSLEGQEAEVVERVDSGSLRGKIRVGGDLWSAQSDETIEAGTRVIIERIEGVRAIVRRKAS